MRRKIKCLRKYKGIIIQTTRKYLYAKIIEKRRSLFVFGQINVDIHRMKNEKKKNNQMKYTSYNEG